MPSEAQYRKERIERLLHELRYEIERGIMENEIEEHLSFEFIIPISREIPNGGMVWGRFRVAPHPSWHVPRMPAPTRLHIVGGIEHERPDQ